MAGLRILRAAERPATPWRNGGGVTHEIARSPAEGEDFAWRVSIATIEHSGPFSSFPDCERTLVLLEGGPLALATGSAPRQVKRLVPFRFSGDAECRATLAGATARVLNVITARGRATHALDLHAMAGVRNFEPGLLVVLDGTITLDDARLARFDAAQIDQAKLAKGSGLVAAIAIGGAGP
jgi:environmental stress-induced protein Ves